jgi:hypothetical protein
MFACKNQNKGILWSFAFSFGAFWHSNKSFQQRQFCTPGGGPIARLRPVGPNGHHPLKVACDAFRNLCYWPMVSMYVWDAAFLSTNDLAISKGGNSAHAESHSAIFVEWVLFFQKNL